LFPTTVLSDLTSNALINNKETFGPLAAPVKLDMEEEVIRMANNIEVGLAGYFFSWDMGRVAEKLEVGVVWVNMVLFSQGD
ncbi:hypothetical protein GYMLUDRAFT_1026712, partial [Collybiopsis luxurians FD-317 M1]